MIRIVKGNLLDSTDEIIAHGCNTKGGFGSGVAGAIAQKWPRVRAAYLEKYQLKGWKLGEIQLVYSHYDLTGPIIANMATQENFGYDGKLYVDYNSVRICLDKVLKYANDNNFSISLPKVGTGLAGGEWSTVYNILYKVSMKYENVFIKVYEL